MDLPFLLMDEVGVEYDDNWYSVGNIDYEALDDIPGDLLHYMLMLI